MAQCNLDGVNTTCHVITLSMADADVHLSLLCQVLFLYQRLPAYSTMQGIKGSSLLTAQHSNR